VDRSGQRATITPRIGLEAEPIANVLQLRAGSYLEPSRYSYGEPRVHGTFGVDVSLFTWSFFGRYEDDTYWRVGGFVDGARRYLGWGLTAGIWR
jgi:hypothetical protein